MSAAARAIQPVFADDGLHRRFAADLAELAKAYRPDLSDLAEAVDYIENQMATSQRAIVLAGFRRGFDLPEMKRIICLRRTLSLLSQIKENEAAVRAALAPKQRRG